MLTMNPIIVFIMLFVPSLCFIDPFFFDHDFGSSEEFLKEVNEYRAKFAKEHKIPNMYKLTMLTEKRLEVPDRLSKSSRYISFDSYQNTTEKISKQVNIFERFLNLYFEYVEENKIGPVILEFDHLELLNPLHAFIECSADDLVYCTMRSSGYINFWYANPGEAGSQCPPRFKGEDGLCVPVDPSKNTYWGTKEELLEDVNYMRRKYAMEFGIPNMHQLTWNDSLIEILEPLNLDLGILKSGVYGYVGPENSSSWDGFENSWRITELPSFSAAVPFIDEAVHFVPRLPRRRMNSDGGLELVNPLQTSIGCMEKGIKVKDNKMAGIVVCLLGNMGQSSVLNFDEKKNKKKTPGSECMDGYVNDDGLCVLAPPTTTPEPTTTTPEATTTPKTTPKEAETVPASPMKPDASDEKKEKEGASVEEDAELEPGQDRLDSSTRTYSYGPWILVFTCFLF